MSKQPRIKVNHNVPKVETQEDNYKPQYTTMGISMGGVYATSPNQYSKNTACRTTIPDNRLTPYLGELVEGGMVIDKRPCTGREDFIKWAIAGPMLRESLPKGHAERFTFPQSEPFTCTDPKADKLEYIALDLYCQLWRDMGARIGKRMGNTIQWEDGMVFQIPVWAERELHGECDPIA